MSALAASALGLVLGLAAGPQEAGAHPPRSSAVRRGVARAWRAYSRRFIQRDGRVIDWSDGGVTTSEGQAYALVRAVWADDRRTFDRVLVWTRDNLQGGDGAVLPAWRWGERGGAWGVIDPNPAADADVWMAYALVLAAQRWHEPRYRGQARGLLAAIWDQEVREVGPWTLLLPGPWAVGQDPVRLNPSYFLPFAFRSFAAVDPERDWMALVEGSYGLLEALMPLGTLPPDWVHLDPETAARTDDPSGAPEHSADHGYEAFRVAWTLAADARWHDEPRARALLATYADLGARYAREGRLAAIVDVHGAPLTPYDSPGFYGSLLAAWGEARPSDAAALFEREIAPLSGIGGRGGWGGPDDYYGQNWTWLGVAFWAGVANPPEGL
jgi:endoglucanase